MSESDKDRGPELVFLVGMPRSGTKLLRDLLNRHPEIAIFPNESHFFPSFVRDGSKYGDLSRRESFGKLYADLAQTRFVRRIRAAGIEIDADQWFARLRGSEPGHVLDALFECYAELAGTRIVGDKTPEYVTQVPLLSRLFPQAKFVHIIRDPRDYVISMRKAWGKSLPRAVQRWKDGIRKFQRDARVCRTAFVEVRYEDLISDPRAVLTGVCTFLGVPFRDEMLTLERPSENLGDTQGATVIVSDNFGKWRRELGAAEVRRVESIAGELMRELGYAPEHVAGDEDVRRLLLKLYRVHDAANLVRFRARVGGLAGAFDELRNVLG